MDIAVASNYSINNKNQLEKSEIAGCYYCISIYKASEVTDFIDEGNTALCPKCGIDSVLGDKSGYTISIELLEELNKLKFGSVPRLSVNTIVQMAIKPFYYVRGCWRMVKTSKSK